MLTSNITPCSQQTLHLLSSSHRGYDRCPHQVSSFVSKSRTAIRKRLILPREWTQLQYQPCHQPKAPKSSTRFPEH